MLCCPYLAPHYKSARVWIWYTMAVLQHMMRDDNLSVPNILKQITLGKEIVEQ